MATETKHTPGPWEVFQGGNFLMVLKAGMGKVKGLDKSNRIICEIRTELSCFEGTDEDKANARLIAASPVLYNYAQKKAQEGDKEAKIMLDSLQLTN